RSVARLIANPYSAVHVDRENRERTDLAIWSFDIDHRGHVVGSEVGPRIEGGVEIERHLHPGLRTLVRVDRKELLPAVLPYAGRDDRARAGPYFEPCGVRTIRIGAGPVTHEKGAAIRDEDVIQAVGAARQRHVADR